MSNRKVMQAPKQARTVRPSQTVRGFWDWLIGGYYRG